MLLGNPSAVRLAFKAPVPGRGPFQAWEHTRIHAAVQEQRIFVAVPPRVVTRVAEIVPLVVLLRPIVVAQAVRHRAAT